MTTPDQTIEAMVKSMIEAQVVQALNSAPEAIEKLVKAALSRPVDSLGKFDGYGSKMPYLDWLVGEEIRNAARAAVHKVIAESTDQIEAQVRKGLTQDTVVDAIVKSFTNTANEEWRINVSFEADKRR